MSSAVEADIADEGARRIETEPTSSTNGETPTQIPRNRMTIKVFQAGKDASILDGFKDGWV